MSAGRPEGEARPGVQNLRRGHYQLGLDVAANQRVVMSFAELTRAM